ncbi:hypothetical protein EV363DRAFT_1296544 [Boletus edulis]|nr:hypothetical protein EV363DRAFT_1296544 [Boletus edulis]
MQAQMWINTLSSFVNREANVYALGSILPTVTWGLYEPFQDHRCQLCNPLTNIPIVVWMVGHIGSMWFLKQGKPEKQAAVTVIPLSHSGDIRDATNLVKEFTDDPVNAVRAIKWQNSKASDDLKELFGEVFDAHDILTNKAEMPPYPVEELKKNDLVLLESKIICYKLKDANNNWTIHHVQMEMLTISLLYCADLEESADKETSCDIRDLQI